MASPPEYVCPESCDGCHEYDNREMNDEELDLYYEAVHKSEGFDVPHFPDSYAIGLIMPMLYLPFPKVVEECAHEAIKHYNNQNGTNFEVVNIVKANNQASRGILYFITFEVKPIGISSEFPTTTFQARVLAGIPDIEVQLCRPKPSNN